MRVRVDPRADAVLVLLTDERTATSCVWLDGDRAVHVAEDGRPVAVELLRVSWGVDLDGLPERERIARLLAGLAN